MGGMASPAHGQNDISTSGAGESGGRRAFRMAFDRSFLRSSEVNFSILIESLPLCAIESGSDTKLCICAHVTAGTAGRWELHCSSRQSFFAATSIRYIGQSFLTSLRHATAEQPIVAGQPGNVATRNSPEASRTNAEFNSSANNWQVVT